MKGRMILAFVLSISLLVQGDALVNAHYPVATTNSYVSQWYRQVHDGLDIASRCGKKVLAIRPATVIYSGWRNNGGGYQVWTRTALDGKDFYIIYAHMLRYPYVKVGQHVTKQQLLGLVGSTGNSTGCHLHIETWRGYPWRSGSYTVNPWPYINHGYWLPYRYR